MSSLHTGKLPAETLKRLLENIRIEDEQVVLGPRIGEDAAVIRLGRKLLVAKMDPVTLATDLIGWYAVHVNANDIAIMGVRPRWFMATIILYPAGEVNRNGSGKNLRAGSLGMPVSGDSPVQIRELPHFERDELARFLENRSRAA